jgi:SAM-dependent methyltransferase
MNSRASSVRFRYENQEVKAVCPVCQCPRGHLLWLATSDQAAQHFVLKEVAAARYSALVSHIERLWGGVNCAVVRCEECGFCHSDPFIAGDARFYELAYGETGRYPASRWEFRLTRDVLAGRDCSDRALLEIGAGDGAFLRYVADVIIPKRNITITEYSHYGRMRLHEIGVKCLPMDVRDAPEQDCSDGFDFVCMFQVLEHLDRLDDLFEKLRMLTKKSGSLFISFPNAQRIEFNELNGALLDMPPNHVGRWSVKSLATISKRHGFDVVDHRIEESDRDAMRTQFINYRFMREAQESGSVPNRIARLKSRRLLRGMKRLGLAWTAVAAKPALAAMTPELGDSEWAHLVRADD